KFGIEGQQISDRCCGFGASTEMSAGRRHYEVGPEESGYVHTIRAIERLLVLALVEVIPEGSEVHPACVVRIQFHRVAHNRSAALKLGSVHNLQSQYSERVSVERIEGHRALGRWTKRREVLPKEMRLRQRHHCELVRSIQLDRTARRDERAIERSPVIARKAEGVFVEIDLRET